MALTILSGGQTGVDRAALDAALENGIPAGGWCPQGRLAEDGRIPEHYPLRELPGAGYLQRTEQNVIDSDATLIVHFGRLQGGTARTQEFCHTHDKPLLLIDGSYVAECEAVRMLREFILGNKITLLNVAGPRASGEAGAYAYTFALLSLLLKDHSLSA